MEDDADVRTAMATLLEVEGYRVVGAADGQRAFDLIRRGLRPCIILLDLGLPVMDGHEFRTAQLRDEKLAVIPVVVFSARPDAEEIATSLSAVAALRKPVPFEQLRRLLQQHCLPDASVPSGTTIH